MLHFEGGADDVGSVGVHAEHEGGTVPLGPVVIVCGQHLHHLNSTFVLNSSVKTVKISIKTGPGAFVAT